MSTSLGSPRHSISLALQPMIEAVYERSRYGRRLDYHKPLTPPLSPEETTWLTGRLRTEDTRTKPVAPPKRRGRRR